MTDSPLAVALAKFQAELPHIGKANLAVVKSDKGSYKYTYADLSDISAKVLPLLAKQGLSFSAKPTLHDGKFVLEYTLRHASGESDTGYYPLNASGTPQQIGSAITYARRYALSAVTGIVPDEDDDGQAAAQVPRQQPAQPDPMAAAMERLRDVCAENSWDRNRVAGVFAERHPGMPIGTVTDPNVINQFVVDLFAMSDDQLRATNGAPA